MVVPSGRVARARARLRREREAQSTTAIFVGSTRARADGVSATHPMWDSHTPHGPAPVVGHSSARENAWCGVMPTPGQSITWADLGSAGRKDHDHQERRAARTNYRRGRWTAGFSVGEGRRAPPHAEPVAVPLSRTHSERLLGAPRDQGLASASWRRPRRNFSWSFATSADRDLVSQDRETRIYEEALNRTSRLAYASARPIQAIKLAAAAPPAAAAVEFFVTERM